MEGCRKNKALIYLDLCVLFVTTYYLVFSHGQLTKLHNKKVMIMEVLYKTEHLSCFQYANKKDPVMEPIKRVKGEAFTIYNDVNKILFLTKGKLSCSFNGLVNKTIEESNFFFVPAKSNYSSIAVEDSEILLLRLNTHFNFCDHFSFEMLFEDNVDSKNSESKITVLPVVEPLQKYLELLENYLQSGLKCTYFLDLKMKEFFFLLRAYYKKTDLRDFFTPVLSTDIQFSNKVYEFCDKVKSSKELASLMHYSLSGFDKRFKRVFGVPTYQWLKTRKARNIYHDINCTKKTFSELAYEYGFSSASYFNDFCKINFGKTPGEIRKRKLEEYSINMI